MAVMITIEVRGQRITWPKEFAAVMIGYYRKHGVPFEVEATHVDEDLATAETKR